MFDFLNGPVRDLVTAIYEAVGYLGVALWVAIESVVIPIPSELVLPFAGFLAADPTSVEPITGAPWTIPLLVVFATIGSLLGALVAYAIGFFGGRPLLMRWGGLLRFTEDDLDRTEAFFAKWGSAAAFIGRMIPVVRSLVSFGAGVGRMPLAPFIVFTVLGSIPWNLALVLAGFALGENWAHFEALLARYEFVVLGILIVIGLGYLWFKRDEVPADVGLALEVARLTQLLVRCGRGLGGVDRIDRRDDRRLGLAELSGGPLLDGHDPLHQLVLVHLVAGLAGGRDVVHRAPDPVV